MEDIEQDVIALQSAIASEKLRRKFKELELDQGDDPLYDDMDDDKNEKWMKNYIQVTKGCPESDAVLNCPCCFTVLTNDCQRHEIFSDQYRSMFVSNCKISCDHYITYYESTKQNKLDKSKWDRIAVTDTAHNYDRADLFYPVYCAHCDTEVGVFDCEEIYHFYNVISSY